MANQIKSRQGSLNKLVLVAFIALLIGFAGGYYLSRLEAQKSQASCSNATRDVTIYLNHLIGIVSSGGTITQRQMNTFLDLIEIRDECYEAQWQWNMTA
jgi:lipopolysaccharide biosynthesis regulator YciM